MLITPGGDSQQGSSVVSLVQQLKSGKLSKEELFEQLTRMQRSKRAPASSNSSSHDDSSSSPSSPLSNVVDSPPPSPRAATPQPLSPSVHHRHLHVSRSRCPVSKGGARRKYSSNSERAQAGHREKPEDRCDGIAGEVRGIWPSKLRTGVIASDVRCQRKSACREHYW